MKILYVARHDSGGNDDEGAITASLRKLGHEVECVQETEGRLLAGKRADLLLFHKWSDAGTLSRMKMPAVFWYFDLVNSNDGDKTLEDRNKGREAWMARMMPAVKMGFCTDGDWVRKHPEKLVTLRQGMDSRVGGRGVYDGKGIRPILFMGIRDGGGVGRMGFVDEMKYKYGERFAHVPSGVHGGAMSDLIASALVVVAPDSPVTDHYWSNRVYQMLGRGAFLLHPWCSAMGYQYSDGVHLRYYRGREELHKLIRHYLDRPEERQLISEQGMAHTLEHHTYDRRCSDLMQWVAQRVVK